MTYFFTLIVLFLFINFIYTLCFSVLLIPLLFLNNILSSSIISIIEIAFPLGCILFSILSFWQAKIATDFRLKNNLGLIKSVKNSFIVMKVNIFSMLGIQKKNK